VRVRRVDRDRAHARAFGRGDLVAHERQQRRDQHGGTGALLPEQQGRDEVDGRLAPPGPLHDQRPPSLGDQRLDRLVLPVVELGVGPTDQGPQGGEGGRVRLG
jgi:hypothetical protein